MQELEKKIQENQKKIVRVEDTVKNGIAISMGMSEQNTDMTFQRIKELEQIIKNVDNKMDENYEEEARKQRILQNELTNLYNEN